MIAILHPMIMTVLLIIIIILMITIILILIITMMMMMIKLLLLLLLLLIIIIIGPPSVREGSVRPPTSSPATSGPQAGRAWLYFPLGTFFTFYNTAVAKSNPYLLPAQFVPTTLCHLPILPSTIPTLCPAQFVPTTSGPQAATASVPPATVTLRKDGQQTRQQQYNKTSRTIQIAKNTQASVQQQ